MVKPIQVFKLTHKWLGILLAPLMVMWFISGYFMIFSGFPRVKEESRLKMLDHLNQNDSIVSMNQLRQWYSAATEENTQLAQMSIEKSNGNLLLTLSGDMGEVVINSSTQKKVIPKAPTLEYMAEMTYRITGQSIHKIDTMSNLNQWIPFGQRRADLPIYKVSASDSENTKLFFSGQDGKLLQQTDKHNRILAYFGAIPHWLYFWQIRQNADLWKNIFVVLGVVGCTMIISGIIMGVYRAAQSRRRKPKQWSPYKHKWHYWHHITGLLFGIFVLTWMFSGWMSVDSLPKWMTGPKPAKEYYTLANSIQLPASCKSDLELILKERPSLKRITSANYLGQDYFLLETEKKKEYVMISGGELTPLHISQDEIIKYVSAHSKDEIVEVKEITEYTPDYLPHPKGKRKPPLPALQINTNSGTTLYVSHSEPRIQIVNKSTIMNSWAYSKLHAFKFLWAYHHPTLWLIVMLTLLSGGLAVSFTGFALGIRSLTRTFRRKSRK